MRAHTISIHELDVHGFSHVQSCRKEMVKHRKLWSPKDNLVPTDNRIKDDGLDVLPSIEPMCSTESPLPSFISKVRITIKVKQFPSVEISSSIACAFRG